MELKFLGIGGAFDFEYGNSSAFVEFAGERILLDCGCNTYQELRACGLADNIDAILITHMHDDHVGSLSTMILHHRHMLWPARKAKILYPNTPNGIRLKDEIIAYLVHSLQNPKDFIDFEPISEESGIRFFDTTGKHVNGMISFGYYFENEEEIIIYSGDLGDPNVVFELVKELPPQKRIRIFHEVFFFPTNGVHTYYKDLFPQLEKYEIYGYHNNPTMAPKDNLVPLVADHPEFLYKN